jgi:hypothetical protein
MKVDQTVMQFRLELAINPRPKTARTLTINRDDSRL